MARSTAAVCRHPALSRGTPAKLPFVAEEARLGGTRLLSHLTSQMLLLTSVLNNTEEPSPRKEYVKVIPKNKLRKELKSS